MPFAFPAGAAGTASLYDQAGHRKYLNAAERRRFLAALGCLSDHQALFAETLFWTGARLTEVLSLTPDSLQPEAGVVAIRTLKRRRHHVREIPVPAPLMAALAALTAPSGRLFPWSRTSGWRIIRLAMKAAGIDGPKGSPRGLRHGFGIACLSAGVPETLLQRWLGHSRLSTTAIYADALGPEEQAFAHRLWKLAA